MSLARIYADPEGQLIAQLAVRRLIERAIREGALRADIEPDEIADLLCAPIYFRLLFQKASLEAGATEQLVDTAPDGLGIERARPESATSTAGPRHNQATIIELIRVYQLAHSGTWRS